MVLIKELTEVSDLQQIPGLEQAIWGNPDPVPTSIMRVMADHGGGIWGAMEDEVWIGFAMAMAARDENGWYLHSQIFPTPRLGYLVVTGCEIRRLR